MTFEENKELFRDATKIWSLDEMESNSILWAHELRWMNEAKRLGIETRLAEDQWDTFVDSCYDPFVNTDLDAGVESGFGE